MSAAGKAPDRNRGGLTDKSTAYIARALEVLEEMRDYWPLTLRQVYYQLVAAEYIPNNELQYKKLSRLLSEARIDDRVPWDAMEDRSRTSHFSYGWPDRATFVAEQTEQFLDGYRRDLMQSQPLALEVWVEKDALSRICHTVAFPYCVSVIVGKGFSSTSYVHEFRKRIVADADEGRPTRILYFGDLDPSGWAMLPAMLEKLQVKMKLGDMVEGQMYGLTPEHVDQYQLPHSIDAMKETDSRTPKFKAWLRARGYPDDLAVELDALRPDTLEDLVRDAIVSNLDLSLFEQEEAIERAELEELAEDRARVIALMRHNVENIEDGDA